MMTKMIGGLQTALLIGVAAGVLVLSTQATARMHGGAGTHGSGSSLSVSAPPPNMSPPSSGMHSGMSSLPVSTPPSNMSPPSSGMQTPMGHPMGWHDRDHDHDHDHHHRHFDDDDDFFFFDPFWWGYSDYPYTVETRYVEVPVADGYWYYCPDSKSYYPYARECASKWERVLPQPPPE